ncbi:MAG: hypothetical protein DYG92_04225 [Leptolyngbya sp. PLA1]|nr:hypothetical protein [Leptolyngbya sp. PLA1]
MNTARTAILVAALPLLATVFPMGACERKTPPAPQQPAGSGNHAQTTGTPAGQGDPHEHADGKGHGATTQLGEKSNAGWTVKASRDGEIAPGKEAAIDAWITGDAAKIAAVRFWIGTQDAKGSVKARAEIETDNWHTHVEVPGPLPAGSKLWIEIESDKGEKTLVDFDLKL